jgi:outer membrane protein assembly factor BamB
LIGDQIIFRTADKIYSISAVNGGTNWEISARASDITINVNHLGKPIVGNSEFLVSEEQNNSIGIYSTNTGKKIWNVDGQVNFVYAIEIVDEVMIVARHDGNLVVYDLTSHQELWEAALPPRSYVSIAANTDLVILGVASALRIYGLRDGRLLNEKTYHSSVIGDIVLSGSNLFVSYVNNGSWNISSLQRDSLDENWVFHAGEIPDIHLSGTIDRLNVFDQTLLLLDTNDGNVIWKDDTQEYYSAPTFHENSLFFISRQGIFDKNLCKVEIREGAMEDCSVMKSTGMLFNFQGHLLGPLTANELLIVPRGSEIVAFAMP